ncbi:hypothetical protein B1VFA_018 [Rhizobium phage B1VFA]|nr:hypothetical protein B1VFA_018 [Rhizobium phage B1VFA]
MTAVSGVTSHAYTDTSFLPFAEAVRERFAASIKVDGPLFTTDAGDLWEEYLNGFDDPAERQGHNCNCCRSFIRHYGGLVTIDDKGIHHSALWNVDLVPAFFKKAVTNLRKAVDRATVNGVFVSSDATWGTAKTGPWNHFAVAQSPERIHRDRVNTAFQVMAQKKQDFGTLKHGLADYSRDVVASAVNLLESEALYRSEKVIGPAKFLLAIHDAYQGRFKHRYENLIWKAVATAPVGFCTPRSSMIGTLLDDLKEGMSVELVKSRFKTKMDPLQYQRPQAAPSAGNIAVAEKLVEKLGIQNSLKRRFARLEEITTIWTPTAAATAPATGGVFGHLTPKGAAFSMQAAPVAPIQNITWEKFLRTVVPKALSMDLAMHSMSAPFAALVTAEDPDAPPILQWDHEEKRNPFSWYLYSGGSRPGNWNLPPAGRIKVNAISLKPSSWNLAPGADDNQGKGALFILEGCRDLRTPGLCLFPEILKSSLHSIRSTIEAFSHRGKMSGQDEASACGVLCDQKGLNYEVRVTTDLGRADYRIDRWD